jgi:GMP synthase (glutamine-hydrolysing)
MSDHDDASTGSVHAPRAALVLQHVPWEGPGLIADALRAAGVRVVVRTVLDDAAPALPAPDELAALVVMGGPMGALDDEQHPGLAAERALLAACVAAEVPVLGVCLGMQLLGVALGGELLPGYATEIGFGHVQVLAEDPLLRPLVGSPVLHWHCDAVTLPPGGTVLARTAATPVQAFRVGSAVGMQFHAEVDAALLAAWMASPTMTADLVTHGVTDLAEQAAVALPALTAAATFAPFAAAAAVR